jgi:hypothetical protein
MHEQEVSNCISGLGRLGAEWSDLTPTVRGLLGNDMNIYIYILHFITCNICNYDYDDFIKSSNLRILSAYP